MNSLAAVLTIIAFALAVYVIRQEDGKSNWTENTHFTVGLVIFLATLLQVTLALFRPHHHTPVAEPEATANEEMPTDEHHPEEKMASMEDDPSKEAPAETSPPETNSLRRVWEHKHRWFGFGLLATAWWQIQDGWELYEHEIGGKDQGMVFLATAAGISGTFVILYMVHKAGELYGSKD